MLRMRRLCLRKGKAMTAVLVIILAAAIAFGLSRKIRKLRRGGGCCGEFEKSEKRISVKDRNKSHYPYSVELSISGMTCINCARKVENTINSLDGVWAKVDLNTSTAKIYSKTERDINELCGIIAKAGYTAQLKGK